MRVTRTLCHPRGRPLRSSRAQGLQEPQQRSQAATARAVERRQHTQGVNAGCTRSLNNQQSDV
jgi:hypothetical protein